MCQSPIKCLIDNESFRIYRKIDLMPWDSKVLLIKASRTFKEERLNFHEESPCCVQSGLPGTNALSFLTYHLLRTRDLQFCLFPQWTCNSMLHGVVQPVISQNRNFSWTEYFEYRRETIPIYLMQDIRLYTPRSQMIPLWNKPCLPCQGSVFNSWSGASNPYTLIFKERYEEWLGKRSLLAVRIRSRHRGSWTGAVGHCTRTHFPFSIRGKIMKSRKQAVLPDYKYRRIHPIFNAWDCISVFAPAERTQELTWL